MIAGRPRPEVLMTGTTVSLTLTDEERALLQEILEEWHRTLLIEISHTDHHHFKALLQKKAELLESMLSRFMVYAA
jgi:hypothetical protein